MHAGLETDNSLLIVLLAISSDSISQDGVLQILIDNHMLTADEEVRLRQGLNFSQDDRWLALLYR